MPHRKSRSIPITKVNMGMGTVILSTTRIPTIDLGIIQNLRNKKQAKRHYTIGFVFSQATLGSVFCNFYLMVSIRVVFQHFLVLSQSLLFQQNI